MREMTDAERRDFRLFEIEPETCTCVGCASNEVCECAFDPYNSDGDCLNEK